MEKEYARLFSQGHIVCECMYEYTVCLRTDEYMPEHCTYTRMCLRVNAMNILVVYEMCKCSGMFSNVFLPTLL
jgi:hypothetical protein